MYWVQYFCPRQGPVWHTGQRSYGTLQAAIAMAHTVKPPAGVARVIDAQGQVWYQC